MGYSVDIIGGGLAGSEAALQLALRKIRVRLIEMRPVVQTPVHTGAGLAELVCSNSLKAFKLGKPAGMLKLEMAALGSYLLEYALASQVSAGGALAVDRQRFSALASNAVSASPFIDLIRAEALSIESGCIRIRQEDGIESVLSKPDAIIIATGPLTSDAFADYLSTITGSEHLAFYDAAAPIVMADSLDYTLLFRQSRYEEQGSGDYLNAPMSKEEYDRFIHELVAAKRVIAKDFETSELFCACQPVEEIARRGHDAPRHGTMKPVGLVDPRTGKRPWAALQLRAENEHLTSYNLVGFQTNLTFPEQERVFRMIPGLEHAEFARYGVMHRNTFVDAPRLLDRSLRFKPAAPTNVYLAGQVAGTEGYCEAVMAGLYAALQCAARLDGYDMPTLPEDTAFGSLLAWATDNQTRDYQPMHVNFGVYPPLEKTIKNKSQRYTAFADRERRSIDAYRTALIEGARIPHERTSLLGTWVDFVESKQADNA